MKNEIVKNYNYYNNINRNKWDNPHLTRSKIYNFFHKKNIKMNKKFDLFKKEILKADNEIDLKYKNDFIAKVKEENKNNLKKRQLYRLCWEKASKQNLLDKNKDNIKGNEMNIHEFSSLKRSFFKKPYNIWNNNTHLQEKDLKLKFNKKIIKMDEKGFQDINNKINSQIEEKNSKDFQKKLEYQEIYTQTHNKYIYRSMSRNIQSSYASTKFINSKKIKYLSKRPTVKLQSNKDYNFLSNTWIQ